MISERKKYTNGVYYLKNKKLLNEKSRKWRLDNLERNKKQTREYRLNNKERIAAYAKIYRSKHREYFLAYHRQWTRNNPQKIEEYYKRYYQRADREKLREEARAYYKKNSERARERTRIYRSKNRDRVLAYSKKYRKESGYFEGRYKTDIQYRLTCLLRKRLRQAIKGNSKQGSAIKLLGCSISELKFYLEGKFQEGMSWDNWKSDGWHIDHAIPLAYYDLQDKNQLALACHYTNLQPLWAKENISKGAKIYV